VKTSQAIEKHARTRCAHQLQGLSIWLDQDLVELFYDDVLDGGLPRSRSTCYSDHQWFAIFVIWYVVLEKLHTASFVPLKPDLSVAERMSGAVLWCCKLCSQRHLQLSRDLLLRLSQRGLGEEPKNDTGRASISFSRFGFRHTRDKQAAIMSVGVEEPLTDPTVNARGFPPEGIQAHLPVNERMETWPHAKMGEADVTACGAGALTVDLERATFTLTPSPSPPDGCRRSLD
jgi:hypothetical protein